VVTHEGNETEAAEGDKGDGFDKELEEDVAANAHRQAMRMPISGCVGAADQHDVNDARPQKRR